MSYLSWRFAIGLSLCLAPIVAASHHAAAGLYDNEAIGEVEGVVVSVFWRNPHVRFRLERTGDNGQPETWEIEGGSVNTLERVGLRADMLKVGDQVRFAGFPGRNARRAIFARTVTLASGEQLALAVDLRNRYAPPAQGTASADADAELDIFRVWVPIRMALTDSAEITFPLTPSARGARVAYDPGDDPALRCIPPGMPSAMDNPYPIEFLERGEEIILRLEEWDGVRTIHMDDGSSAERSSAGHMGYSRGRWEGNTLVVETTDIDYAYFDDLGTPMSGEAVVLERFTLHPGERRLTWDARVTDPQSFTEPVVMDMEWAFVPGQEIKPFNCTLEPAPAG